MSLFKLWAKFCFSSSLSSSLLASHVLIACCSPSPGFTLLQIQSSRPSRILPSPIDAAHRPQLNSIPFYDFRPDFGQIRFCLASHRAAASSNRSSAAYVFSLRSSCFVHVLVSGCFSTTVSQDFTSASSHRPELTFSRLLI